MNEHVDVQGVCKCLRFSLKQKKLQYMFSSSNYLLGVLITHCTLCSLNGLKSFTVSFSRTKCLK